jgi:hypothetical protein
MKRSLLYALAASAALVACTEQSATRLVEPSGGISASHSSGSSKTTTSNMVATFQLPLPGSGFSVVSDGQFESGGVSLYTNGVCGVKATVFAPNPSQDAVMQTDNPTMKDRKCAAWPRKVTVDYGDGTETFAGTFNVHDAGSVAVGSTAPRFFGMAPTGSARCTRIQFGGPNGGEMVQVTRTSAGVWRVQSEAGATDNAACLTASGAVVTYTMSVDLTVTTP